MINPKKLIWLGVIKLFSRISTSGEITFLLQGRNR